MVVYVIAVAILATLLIGGHWWTGKSTKTQISNDTKTAQKADFNDIATQVYPVHGFVLPVGWGDVANELVDNGALNVSFMKSALNSSGEPLTEEEIRILAGTSENNITLNSSSALFSLYVLWALGINNRNIIISNGPIAQYENSYEFASTGGYGPLGKLSLGKLTILNLSGSEQSLVVSIASNTYRPCCDNPALFPDCNHGAAQLGLIELMASGGANASQIYGALKDFNSFYYPEQYVEDAVFLNYTRGKAWGQIPGNQILGYNFSSASGHSAIHQYLLSSNTITGATGTGGSRCGV